MTSAHTATSTDVTNLIRANGYVWSGRVDATPLTRAWWTSQNLRTVVIASARALEPRCTSWPARFVASTRAFV